jgi:ribosome-binding factor A
MAKRNLRVADQIRKDLTDIIRNESHDPRIDPMISVTDVDVTSDLSLARVYVSKLGSAEERQELCDILNNARGFFRSALGKRLNLRVVPELRFYVDDSLAYGAKIENILNHLEEEK